MDTDAIWAAIMADPVQTDLISVFENGLSPTTCMFPVHLLTKPYIEFIKQTVEKHKDDKFYIFCVQTEVIAVAQLHAERIKDQQRTYRQWVLDTIMPSIRNPNEPLEEYAFRIALEVVSNPSYKRPKFNDTPPVVPVKDESAIDTTEYSTEVILSRCRPSVFSEIKSAFETLVKKIEIISDLNDFAREKMRSFATSGITEIADDLKEGVYGKGLDEIMKFIKDNVFRLSTSVMAAFKEFVGNYRNVLNELIIQFGIFAGLAIIYEMILSNPELSARRDSFYFAALVVYTIFKLARFVMTESKGTPRAGNAAPSGLLETNLLHESRPIQLLDTIQQPVPPANTRAGWALPKSFKPSLASTPSRSLMLPQVDVPSSAIQAVVGQPQQTGPVQNMIIFSRCRNVIEEVGLMHLRNYIITGSSMFSLYPSATSQISVPALVAALITALKMFAVVELTFRREFLHSITWTHLVATALTGVCTILPMQMVKSYSMAVDDIIIPFISALSVDYVRNKWGKVLSDLKTKKIILTVVAGAATVLPFMPVPSLLSNILFSDPENMTFDTNAKFFSDITNTDDSFLALVSNFMAIPQAGLAFASLAAACSALNTAGDFKNDFKTLNDSIIGVKNKIQGYEDYVNDNPNRVLWANNPVMTNPFARGYQYEQISIYGPLKSNTAVDSKAITMLCRFNNFSDNHTKAVMSVYHRDMETLGLTVGPFFNNPVNLNFLSNAISRIKKVFDSDETTVALLLGPFAYASNNTFIGSMKLNDTMRERFFTTLQQCVMELQNENNPVDVLAYANAYNATLDCMKKNVETRAQSIRESIHDANTNLTFPTVKEYTESFLNFVEKIKKNSSLPFPNMDTEFFDFCLSIVLQIRIAAKPEIESYMNTMIIRETLDYSTLLQKDAKARNCKSKYLINSDVDTVTDNMLAIYVSPESPTSKTNTFCASIPYLDKATSTIKHFVMNGQYNRIKDVVIFDELPDKGSDLNLLVNR